MLDVCVEESYAQSENCTTDMDCNNGTRCVEGVCMILDPCISLTCQQEEFCKEGICIRDNNNSFIQCSQDEDCNEGFACSSLNICVDPEHPLHNCGGGLSCGSKARCQNEKCIPLPKPGEIFNTIGGTILTSSITLMSELFGCFITQHSLFEKPVL